MRNIRSSTLLFYGFCLCLLLVWLVPYVFAADGATTTVRVVLEIETADGKESVPVSAEVVGFSKDRFVKAAVSADTLASNGNTTLRSLNNGNRDACDSFETAYIDLVSSTSFNAIPSEYASIVSRYEYAIQVIADEARDMYLYCYNDGGFSSFNYQLATHGYNEGSALLNGIAREAIDSIDTIKPDDLTPTPQAPDPEQPTNPGGSNGDSGTDLYFGEGYPKADARAILFVNQADGSTSQIAPHPNIIPFSGENFTSVLLVSNAFIDFMRLELLTSMGDGNRDRCDDLIGAYTILALSPVFSEVPADYQAWVDEYEAAIFLAVDGTKDLTQWCFNDGPFPTFSYSQAVAAIDTAQPKLSGLAELALNAFGVPLGFPSE